MTSASLLSPRTKPYPACLIGLWGFLLVEPFPDSGQQFPLPCEWSRSTINASVFVPGLGVSKDTAHLCLTRPCCPEQIRRRVPCAVQTELSLEVWYLEQGRTNRTTQPRNALSSSLRCAAITKA